MTAPPAVEGLPDRRRWEGDTTSGVRPQWAMGWSRGLPREVIHNLKHPITGESCRPSPVSRYGETVCMPRQALIDLVRQLDKRPCVIYIRQTATRHPAAHQNLRQRPLRDVHPQKSVEAERPKQLSSGSGEGTNIVSNAQAVKTGWICLSPRHLLRDCVQSAR
jgi:hypothetical protein